MWKYFLNFGNGSKFKILGNKNIFGTFLEFYKFRKIFAWSHHSEPEISKISKIFKFKRILGNLF